MGQAVGAFPKLFPSGTRKVDSFLDPGNRKKVETVLKTEILRVKSQTTYL